MSLEIPLLEADSVLTLDVNTDFPSDPSDLCRLLKDEKCADEYWLAVARGYFQLGQYSAAEQVAETCLETAKPDSKPEIYALLSMLKIQTAPDQKSAALDLANEAFITNEKSVFGPLAQACCLAAQQNTDQSSDLFAKACRLARGTPAEKAVNQYAQMLNAKSLYARNNTRAALKAYQSIIRQGVTLVGRADPRVGCGCCYWKLGDLEHAYTCFKRSLEVCKNREQGPALCLLGLWHLNAAFHGPRSAFEGEYVTALDLLQRAFKMGQRAIPALKIASHLFSKHDMPEVCRLSSLAAEETNLPQLKAESHFLNARAAHYDSDLQTALQQYTLALEFDPNFEAASLGKGSVEWLLDQRADAVHTLMSSAKMHTKSLSSLLYAGLFTFLAKVPNQVRQAKIMLEQYLTLSKQQNRPIEVCCLVALTQIYENEGDFSRAFQYLKDARATNPQNESWTNNAGALAFTLRDFETASELFKTVGNGGDGNNDDVDDDKFKYNRARTLEESDQQAAIEQYKLVKHVYARCREALINNSTTSSETLMNTYPSNLDIRALHAYNLHKDHNKESIVKEQQVYKDTVQHYNKHDVYTLVCMGNVYLRNAQNTAPKDARQRQLSKAADFFAKALQTDSKCAYAAQGLAIILSMLKVHAQSLHIFAKLRDVIQDRQTLLNAALAMFEARDYTRSTEIYTIAHTISADAGTKALLARALVMKSSTVENLEQALQLVTDAHTLLPSEESAVNLAVVQLKFAEAVLVSSNRTIKTLEQAVDASTQAEPHFQSTPKLAKCEKIKAKLTQLLEETRESFNTAEQRKSEAKKAREAELARKKEEAEARIKEEEAREAALAAERERLALETLAWQEEQAKMREEEPDEEKPKRKSKKRSKSVSDHESDRESDRESGHESDHSDREGDHSDHSAHESAHESDHESDHDSSRDTSQPNRKQIIDD